jgi:hypothetical protein
MVAGQRLASWITSFQGCATLSQHRSTGEDAFATLLNVNPLVTTRLKLPDWQLQFNRVGCLGPWWRKPLAAGTQLAKAWHTLATSGGLNAIHWPHVMLCSIVTGTR